MPQNSPPLSEGTFLTRPVRPVALAIVIARGRNPGENWVLLKTRNSVEGILLEFPGGKIEAEESPCDAASRELYEECGILIKNFSLFQVYSYEYPKFIVILHAFVSVCSMDDGTLVENEVQFLHRLESEIPKNLIVGSHGLWRDLNILFNRNTIFAKK